MRLHSDTFQTFSVTSYVAWILQNAFYLCERAAEYSYACYANRRANSVIQMRWGFTTCKLLVNSPSPTILEHSGPLFAVMEEAVRTRKIAQCSPNARETHILLAGNRQISMAVTYASVAIENATSIGTRSFNSEIIAAFNFETCRCDVLLKGWSCSYKLNYVRFIAGTKLFLQDDAANDLHSSDRRCLLQW
jgi:hypothetical protein